MVSEKNGMECDVIVVGYGAAGTAAAISAHDNGAKVILLEKMHEGGGNSRICGGNIIQPKSMQFADYLEKLSYGMTDGEIIRLFVENALKNGDWVRSLGGDLTVFRPLRVSFPMAVAGPSFPEIPGSQEMLKYNVKNDKMEDPPSKRMWDLFVSAVEKRKGIQVMLDTPAKHLVQNANGEITGVVAENKGKEFTIKAKKGVILTCGGYENDPALKWDTLAAKPLMFVGNPGNTGDGVRMAAKVGARLWHMAGLSCIIGLKVKEFEQAFPISFFNEGFIFIDKAGKRFEDEAGLEVHEMWRNLAVFDTKKMEYPRIPMYAIFDDQTRKVAPLTGSTSGYNSRYLYKWSLDNMAEVNKGWIIQAKSIGELAGKIGVDKAVLEQTLARYNADCKAGKDTEFGRAKENLRALEGPPYYAVQLYPSLLNTQGGPQRDKEARVLDPFGKPIPRLYVAGELGSIWGFMYQGGNNIGECIVFGTIAGKNAAAEKPLS